MVSEGFKAAKILEKDKLSLEVINLPKQLF